MPGNIYVPNNNPWQNLLPQIVGNLANQYISSRFQNMAQNKQMERLKANEPTDVQGYTKVLTPSQGWQYIRNPEEKVEKKSKYQTVTVGDRAYAIVPSKDDPTKPMAIPITPEVKKETKTKTGTPPYTGKLDYEEEGDVKYQIIYTGKGWKRTGKTAPRYKPETKVNIGGPTINLPLEKFNIQKDATAGALRADLLNNKSDEKVYGSLGNQYNKTNTKNEVAYWNDKKFFDKTEIFKLPEWAIKEGLTPSAIQEMADSQGIAVKKVLRDLGFIE